jgi:hypothetical protein
MCKFVWPRLTHSIRRLHRTITPAYAASQAPTSTQDARTLYTEYDMNLFTNLFPFFFLYRWSVGSVLFLLSWAVLMGPWSYAKHLVSGSRLPFTAAYFGSIALTLYFAIGVCTFSPFLESFFFSLFYLYPLSASGIVSSSLAVDHLHPLPLPVLFHTTLSVPLSLPTL